MLHLVMLMLMTVLTSHFEDTMKGGAYLNDMELVKILVNEAQDRLIELESLWCNI